MFRPLLLALSGVALLFSAPAQADQARHAIAMHGDVKYAPDFTHFDYVNPNAPKGGTVRFGELETFDSFNPFIPRGVSAAGIGLLYATLTVQSSDEPFTEYVGLAETITMPDDRSFVAFKIRDDATWHDGTPVTAEDVKWTFEILISEGQPFYRTYYGDVERVEVKDAKNVHFHFKAGTDNHELPLILGQMVPLPKHYWTNGTRKFSDTTLEPPLGNGPYRVEKVDAGRSVTYARVANWWGENLPVYKGRYNFDRIVFDYYRDRNVELEAFLGGRFDFQQEYTARLWASGYNTPAVRDGRVIKKEIPHRLPQGMQAFAYNVRKPVFQDIEVRRALDYAFDFEWTNKQLAHNSYTRNNSYFTNSELAAEDGPPTGRVLEILEPFRDQLPESVFITRYQPPKTDGSGNNRENMRIAAKILDDAGYVLKNGVRTHKDTGIKLEFEFLTNTGNAALDRWIMPFIQNLEKLGVKAKFRSVDVTQYINRMMKYDFDVTIPTFSQSQSPGNEQREMWTSARADVEAGRNIVGIKNKVVDTLVEDLIGSDTREELVYHARALDRVLLAHHYVVPNWHLPAWRVAYWDKFGQPDVQAPYALGVVDTWWSKDAK